MPEKKMKSIWFFVALVLIIMGGIILITGIYHLIDPPQHKTVLAEIHPNIWWGAIMILFGGLMYWKTKGKE